MKDANPYEAPASPPDHTQSRRTASHPPSRSWEEDARVLRYAQLGIRLLGVMLIVDGISSVLGSIAYGVIQSSQAGGFYAPDWYAVGWFASALPQLVFGAYFVLDGRWLLEKVFLPPSSVSAPATDDLGTSED